MHPSGGSSERERVGPAGANRGGVLLDRSPLVLSLKRTGLKEHGEVGVGRLEAAVEHNRQGQAPIGGSAIVRGALAQPVSSGGPVPAGLERLDNTRDASAVRQHPGAAAPGDSSDAWHRRRAGVQLIAAPAIAPLVLRDIGRLRVLPGARRAGRPCACNPASSSQHSASLITRAGIRRPRRERANRRIAPRSERRSCSPCRFT